MKILFIGDIFGRSGRSMVKDYLQKLKEKYEIDFVIVNAENSCSGKGLNWKIFNQLLEWGVDFITMGNHTWSKEECLEILDQSEKIIRPLNLKETYQNFQYGEGTRFIEFNGLKIRVTNLLGNSVRFREQQTNCFTEFRTLLNNIDKCDIHIVDFHAETTAEKNAFLWAFDGKVSAILGTHTHIQTNDAVVTNNGTAYISDVGMTGPSCGIIGGEKTSIINNFFNPEQRFILSVQPGPKQLSAVVLTFNDETKKVEDIESIIIKSGFKSLGKTSFPSF